MKIAIVVLHFLDQDLTIQCLESIKNLETTGFIIEVIVVNNNPKENLKKVKEKFEDFIFIDAQQNLGFTGGNNLGIKRALEKKADWIFLVNNDTALDKEIVIQLVKTGESDEDVGILGPKIYFAPGYEFHRERYKPSEKGKVIWYAGGLIDWQNVLASHRGVDEVDKGQYDEQIETDFVSGCAMMVKREVFEKIGLLDEKIFLYWEDSDFCQRAKQAGFKVVYEPQTKLWHANAGSSVVGGSLQDYYLTRNRLLFGTRYASVRTKLALIKEGLGLLIKGREWQKIGVRDFFIRRLGKGSWR